MHERYGASVGKADISRGFQKEQESAGVERTNVGREFGKQRESFGCLHVKASWNSILTQQSRLVLPSPLALPSLLALASPRRVLLRWHLFVCRHLCFKVHSHKRNTYAC